ncbi:unnamed protein product [Schistosoma curassoni]|uniref:Uncharacterized protein n=1 Tax=Schistosoma curassoni TaxID=6186 RepID=A0A183JNF7_9TREM|nr:unnamed protein product [Schistosoma curassoni]
MIQAYESTDNTTRTGDLTRNKIKLSLFLHLELPGPIHLEETKELIQFSKGNPALCAQVEVGTINNDSSSSSSTSTTTWNSIHFSSNYSPYIIINKNIFHSETNNRYIELSNCKPLSWDHYTEIPITLQNKFHFRARYCIYGYSTMCTEYIKPIKGNNNEVLNLTIFFIVYSLCYQKQTISALLNRNISIEECIQDIVEVLRFACSTRGIGK